MSGEKRAFANKLSTRRAADVRKQVSSVTALQELNRSFSHSPSPEIIKSKSLSTVEPYEYDKFVAEHECEIDETFSSVLCIPLDDWEIITEVKANKIVDEKTAKNENSSDRVRDFINFYESKYRILRRNYEDFAFEFTNKESIEKSLNEFQFLECEQFEDTVYHPNNRFSGILNSDDSELHLNSSEPDNLLDDVFLWNRNSDEIDEKIREERLSNRKFCIFNLYDSQSNIELLDSNIQPRHLKPFDDNYCSRILLNIQTVEIDRNEPFFATLAIYDAVNRKKVSENFYFDYNSTELLQYIIRPEIIDHSTRAKSCLININQPVDNLFFVIFIEKVLYSPEVAETLLALKKEKNVTKSAEVVRQIYEKLGNFRTLVAWIPLSFSMVMKKCINSKNKQPIDFPDNLSIDRKQDSIRKRNMDSSYTRHASLERSRSTSTTSIVSSCSFSSETSNVNNDMFINFTPSTVKLPTLYKIESEKFREEDLYKYLNDTLNSSSMIIKKLKSFQATIEFTIMPCTGPTEYVFSPQLQRMLPFPNYSEFFHPVKELADFSDNILHPFYSYTNLLYIFPKFLNFSNRAGRNYQNLSIKIQLFSADGQQVLNHFFGKSNGPEFVSQAFTTVTYHSKTPEFHDEIKMKLPEDLTEFHFLLFTVYHISCKRKDDNQQAETAVGYSWLPILRDGQLKVGDISLPMLTDPPTENLFMCHPADVPSTGHKHRIKWIDNKKDIFNVSLRALSSIYSQDHRIDRFFDMFAQIGRKFRHFKDISTIEKHLKDVVSSLSLAELSNLVQFLPILFDKLFYIFLHNFKVDGQVVGMSLCCLETIARLVIKIETQLKDKGENILRSYVQYNLSATNLSIERVYDQQPISSNDYMHVKLLHEEIAGYWKTANQELQSLLLNSSWFFYEIIIKSAAENIYDSGKLKNPDRISRFSSTFIEDVFQLVELSIMEIQRRDKNAKDLNLYLARFIRDCFTFMDCSFVMKLIRLYCTKFSVKSMDAEINCEIMNLKSEFLKIVCLHEHFFALNLPFGPWYMSSPPVSPCGSICSISSNASNSSTSTLIDRSNYFELPEEFQRQHFLIGQVLLHVSNVLEDFNGSKSASAIGMLKTLLASHDFNVRLNQTGIRSRVAALYMPILNIILSNQARLYRPNEEELSSEMVEKLISQSSLYGKQSNSGAYGNEEKKLIRLNIDETKDLLLCLLFIMKNIDRYILQSWISEYIGTNKVNDFLQILMISMSCFEYQSNNTGSRSNSLKTESLKTQLADAILSSGNARDMILRRKNSSSSIKSEPANYHSNVRWRKDNRTLWNSESSDYTSNAGFLLSPLEGHLTTELTLIVLDIVDVIIESCERQTNVLIYTLKCLLHCLSLNQSTSSLKCIFQLQRSLIGKNPELIFEEGELCAELCFRLLQHCCSMRHVVRSQASASIYFLMRQNFEICNVQITMSLSTLVGQSGKFHEGALRKSLKTILRYADKDSEMQETAFIEQIKDLALVLHSIITNTVKLKEVKNDPEMQDDIMYRIALSYQSSPHLRLTWLRSMAKKHSDRTQYAEEAECYLHAAALVCEYLANVQRLDEDYLPVGCVSFQKLSSNILEESFISDDVLSTADDVASFSSKDFTEIGLLSLLKNCADAFNKAGLPEAEAEICEKMLPIYKAHSDYNNLCKTYARLNEIYVRISCPSPMKRSFGTFFRVGFHGESFGEMDGEEFIYKERSFLTLPDISQRLESLYESQYGRDKVEIVKDSNAINRETLDPTKVYLQITYVEPFFEDYEFIDRRSMFERNFNINRFVYSTPFTRDGKSHGEIGDQYKRKTILTVKNSFPYLKKRVQVSMKHELILTPIEVAIEDVQNKTKQLTEVCAANPIDAKYLQMVLQGSIGTTVNQGPMQIAKIFLIPLALHEISPNKHHNKLRVAFKNFVKKSHEALKLNEKLIRSDQHEYQTELKKNFEDIRHELTFLISPQQQDTVKRKKIHKQKEQRRHGHATVMKENVNSVSHV